jgi:hypothetical protein
VRAKWIAKMVDSNYARMSATQANATDFLSYSRETWQRDAVWDKPSDDNLIIANSSSLGGAFQLAEEEKRGGGGLVRPATTCRWRRGGVPADDTGPSMAAPGGARAAGD